MVLPPTAASTSWPPFLVVLAISFHLGQGPRSFQGGRHLIQIRGSILIKAAMRLCRLLCRCRWGTDAKKTGCAAAVGAACPPSRSNPSLLDGETGADWKVSAAAPLPLRYQSLQIRWNCNRPLSQAVEAEVVVASPCRAFVEPPIATGAIVALAKCSMTSVDFSVSRKKPNVLPQQSLIVSSRLREHQRDTSPANGPRSRQSSETGTGGPE